MSRYDTLRAQRDDIHAALMPNLPQPLMRAAAGALGMTRGDELVYTDTDQLAICTDLALYGVPEGRTLLAAYVRGRAGIDAALQAAMPDAAHHLFQAGPASADGTVPCVPLRGAPFVLHDPQLSQSSMAGVWVSAHVIPLPGAHITTGAPLVIHPDIVEKVRDRDDLTGASLAASLALTQWSYAPAPQKPERPAFRRVSRNAPCPCGSGKRYKACHGRR